LFLTRSGDLLVGSRTMAPRIYTQELDQIDTLGTAERIFVTQYIPEPATIAYLLAAAGVLVWARLRQHAFPAM
jgi:hypothetical protein